MGPLGEICCQSLRILCCCWKTWIHIDVFVKAILITEKEKVTSVLNSLFSVIIVSNYHVAFSSHTVGMLVRSSYGTLYKPWHIRFKRSPAEVVLEDRTLAVLSDLQKKGLKFWELPLYPHTGSFILLSRPCHQCSQPAMRFLFAIPLMDSTR